MADDSKQAQLYGSVRTQPAREIGADIVPGLVQVAAGASVGTVYTFHPLNVNSIIHPQSMLYWDALATSGATIDLGLRTTNTVGVTDDDILLANVDVTSAATTALSVLETADLWIKPVWQIMGLSGPTNLTCFLTATIKDAACDLGGQLGISLVYSS